MYEIKTRRGITLITFQITTADYLPPGPLRNETQYDGVMKENKGGKSGKTRKENDKQISGFLCVQLHHIHVCM